MLTRTERIQIANEVIRKLGIERAIEASDTEREPAEPNKLGFPGVDCPYGYNSDRPTYRTRIRFCSALTGLDTRLTVYRGKCLQSAGLAYALAHTQLWGSCSFCVGDSGYTTEELRAMLAESKENS